MERSTRQLAAVQRNQAASFDAYDRLVRAGIPRQRIEILAPGDPRVASKLTPQPKRSLTKLIGGAMAGMVGGAVFGAAVCGVLWLLGVGLFIAQPWIAAFFIVAYAASAGAIVGAMVGSRFRRSAVAAHAQDAIGEGRWVVVVNARDAEQRARAQEVLGNEPLSLSRAA